MVKKIAFDFPEAKQIEINGDVFNISMTDYEAIELAIKITEDISDISETDYKQITSTIKTLIGLTDRILGEGAMEKILKGHTVNLSFMVNNIISPIMEAVMGDAAEDYTQKINEDYE